MGDTTVTTKGCENKQALVVHSSTPDPWAPRTVLLYEATGTLQTEKEDHPGLSGWPHLITGALTAEGATGGSRTPPQEESQSVVPGEGMWVASGRGELSRWRRASKEMGVSVPQLQGINFRQHSNETGGQFTLRASSGRQNPISGYQTLTLWDLCRKQVKPRCTQTSDLQNCNGINEHRFKLLEV